MLELVQLYRAANPQATDAELRKAVKRKSMRSSSPELRRSIFGYNNAPYDAIVTDMNKLEYARNAQLNLIQTPTDNQATASLHPSINMVQSDTSEKDEISALKK